MYTPPAFRLDDLDEIHRLMNETGLSTLITSTAEGLLATPLPLYLDASEGEYGTLCGHIAKANPQWKLLPDKEALVIFSGSDAYITPSWYAAKVEHGKVVPTWNYSAVHAYGQVEFFEDEQSLYDVVSRITDRFEEPRSEPWSVLDAPENFIKAQLRGIVGVRLPISRLEGKRKMSQNRSQADRKGVAAGLQLEDIEAKRIVASMIPTD